MKPFFWLFFTFVVFDFNLNAQSVFNTAYTRTNVVGSSVNSNDSIFATTVHLAYPVYSTVLDTLYGHFVFSCRQRGDGIDDVYMNKGGFAALLYDDNSLMWKNETTLYDFALSGNHLLVSNDNRTVDFDRNLGFAIQRYTSKLFLSVPESQIAFTYASDTSDMVSCIKLDSVEVIWTARIPRNEDWADVKMLDDTTMLVAASGLHALNLNRGLIWSIPLSTSLSNTGTLVYSPARNNTIKKVSQSFNTCVYDSIITQMSSNILIHDRKIFFASREEVIALAPDGKVIWHCDLRDYEPAKMLIRAHNNQIQLVNFGLAAHLRNFVTRGIPFVLTLNIETGEIEDQYGLAELENLSDFMQSERGMSFGAKETMIEINESSAIVKSKLPLNVSKYGRFHEFIDGNNYYALKGEQYVTLNSIDNELIYFLADNNKVYGIKQDRLLYEYHFTEIFKKAAKVGDKNILRGLKETLVVDANHKLLAKIRLPDNFEVLKEKLYFIDKEKIHIVDLREIR